MKGGGRKSTMKKKRNIHYSIEIKKALFTLFP